MYRFAISQVRFLIVGLLFSTSFAAASGSSTSPLPSPSATPKASEELCCRPVGATPPLAPRALVATALPNANVLLSFGGATGSATGFKVYRSLSKLGPFAVVGTLGANERKFEDRNVGSNTQYFYAVYSIGATPSSMRTLSNIASAVTRYASDFLLTSGWFHSCAIIRGGARCWGDNEYGNLGNGTKSTSSLAAPVVGLSSGVTAISASNAVHTCAIVNGVAACWGRNYLGQLGINSRVDSALPVYPRIPAGSGVVTSITTGENHSCAVTNYEKIWCWGHNYYGQLGSGTPIDSYVPVLVGGISGTVTALSAGKRHTCAVVDRLVKCWGNNDFLQLGNTENPTPGVPVSVRGLSANVDAISSGALHTCALASGGVKCWGESYNGQLGIGREDTIPASLCSPQPSTCGPVSAKGLEQNVTALSSGPIFGLAATTSGELGFWGNYNYAGPSYGPVLRGLGSATEPSISISFAWEYGIVRAVSGGKDHYCVLAGGVVKCLGNNYYQQLGVNGSPSWLVKVLGLE